MKRNWKTVVVIMIVAVLGCVVMAGCEKEPEVPAQMDYRVTLADYAGNAIGSGAIAVFYQDGTQVAMQACDANGVATKNLPTGAYTVKLQFTSGDTYYYQEEGLALTADSPELKVTLYPKASGEQVTLNIPKTTVDELGLTTVEVTPTQVYSLSEGATYVDVKPGERTYFLFMPTRGGMYELSVLEGAGCTLAYYGMPNYIRDMPVYEVLDGVCNINIKNSAATGEIIDIIDENGNKTDEVQNTLQLVVAVESTESTNCVVCIDRIGDPAWDVSQEEWTIYKTTANLEQCVIPGNVELKDFDLTKKYDIVYNKEDGLYHVGTEDGPVVYVYLTEDPRFVDCFQTILEEGAVRAYFYDENGNFVKKEAYGSCLKEYFEYVDDEYGVYPLNKDLMYIIKSYGAHQGWWDRLDKGFVVDVDNLNVDSAWLFLCCYEE